MMPLLNFELRFESRFENERDLVFPCDEQGRVEIDSLSERARIDYLFARAMLGRQYAASRVIRQES